MALFENFPYTNLHELNLDWLIDNIKKLEESQVLSVNGETGHVILYQSENMQLPDVDSNVWQIIRTTDGVTAGIHFNSTTGMATIVNGETLDQIYTHDHPPVYPVYSVNGQTGAVVLYPDQYVRLPDLTDEEMTNWTFFRHLNGISHGIQFDDTGSAYIIDGQNRYKIYADHTGDNPPYPVQSVNGLTGNVQLYTEQYVQLPQLTDPSMDAWTLFRMINSVAVGFKLADDGTVSVINGNDEYPIYIQGINDPSDFDDPEAAVLALSDDVASTDGRQWGMVRTLEADNNTVGIVFKYNTVTAAYETYLKVGSTETKLLTAADIPPGSGVLSVNGQTGAVVLTGEDIHVSTTDTDSLDDAITDIQNNIVELDSLPEALAIVVDGNTATQNITAGNYVVVRNSSISGITDGLYVAVNNVSANTPLTSADLSNSTTGQGGLNALQTVEVENLNAAGTIRIARCGKIRMIEILNATGNEITAITLDQKDMPAEGVNPGENPYFTAFTTDAAGRAFMVGDLFINRTTRTLNPREYTAYGDAITGASIVTTRYMRLFATYIVE